MQIKCVLLVAGIWLLFSRCETLDPKADIPSYIYIKSFKIDNSRAGIPIYSSKITDVWVYIDGKTQGIYELPAIVPIVETGNHRLSLHPGIKRGGISTYRAAYPYYERMELGVINLKPLHIDTIEAVTYYNDSPDNIIIDWEENFESALGLNIEYNPFSDTIVEIVKDPDKVFLDLASGWIFLDDSRDFIEILSPSLKNLPKSQIPIYLEMNYKTDHPFIVGLYVHNKSKQIAIYVVKEQSEWNKIYFDFSEYVQQNSSAYDFNVFIGVHKQADRSKVNIYLDNIKLLHY